MKPVSFFNQFLKPPSVVLSLPFVGQISTVTILMLLGGMLGGATVLHALLGFLGAIIGMVVGGGAMVGLSRIRVHGLTLYALMDGWLQFAVTRILRPDALDIIPDMERGYTHERVVILDPTTGSGSVIRSERGR